MTKLLQQALDALLPHSSSHGNSWRPVEDAAIKAIEQALAQQEPLRPATPEDMKIYKDIADGYRRDVAQQEPNPWQTAVIDQLVVHHIYQAVHDTDPRKAIKDLLGMSNSIALDPQVSSDAQALIDRGRREAQQEQPAQEQVTVLPDGSAFSIMSSPLPADHWLYREREYATPESEETVDLPPPFVNRTTENRELIRLAAMWAIRAATDCGKENDFDPDALVQNFVYATLGPYPQKIKDTAPTQPALIDEMVKQSKMLDSYNDRNIFIDGWLKCEEAHCRGGADK